jgi:hypothetical protein
MFIEANEPVSNGAPCYTLNFGYGDLTIFLSDEQRRQLLDVLSSAPPLPKSDAQIDAELEDDATALPGSGDVEIPAAGARNAGVAEPLRSMLNAISPEVPRAAMGIREIDAELELRRYMSECASGLWRVGGPDAEF